MQNMVFELMLSRTLNKEREPRLVMCASMKSEGLVSFMLYTGAYNGI